ncbi:MAG: HAD family hydrolase [Pseudomonadota bacterium]|nr:HAD family hydrolase [Pseudomonadota bacterium]
MYNRDSMYDSGPGGEPVELVIFDCDGVLIDSEVISLMVIRELLETYGVVIDETYFTREFLGRSFLCVKETVKRDFGVLLREEFEQQYLSALLERFDSHLQPVDGIESLVAQLNIPFCVATSSHRGRTNRALSATGLLSYFDDAIYTASQVQNGKPAPDLFLFAAEQQKVEPKNCLVIEDSLSGLQAGVAAGMQVWHFQGGSHMPASIGSISIPAGISRVISHWSQFFTAHPELRIKSPS